MALCAQFNVNIFAAQGRLSIAYLWRELNRRIGFPGANVGYNGVDFLRVQWSAKLVAKRRHAKVWLTLGDDRLEGEIITRL
jgi:hypothetical protein